MSWLYPIPLEGDGTKDVEALSSYLLRISSKHSVSAGNLLRLALERSGLTTDSEQDSIRGLNLESLIRPNKTTERIALSLAGATGRSESGLESATFMSLVDALDRAQGTYSPRLRWCAECFRESAAATSPTYFRLVWQLTCVECCEVHGLVLRDRCPSCGGFQGGFGVRSELHLCARCGANLYSPPTMSDVRKNQFAPVGDLVEHIATHRGVRFPRSGISRVIEQLLHEAWEIEAEAELFRLLPRDECVRFANASEPITLLSAMRIAFWLHLPVSQLLLGRLDGTSRSLLLSANERLPRHISHGPRKRICAPEEIADQLGARINGSDGQAAPSLRQLARELGVSVGGLRYRYPELLDRAVSAFRTYRVEQRIAIDGQIRNSVAESVRRSVSEGGASLSRKGLLREIRAQSDLPKNRVRRAIADELSKRSGDLALAAVSGPARRLSRSGVHRTTGRKPS